MSSYNHHKKHGKDSLIRKQSKQIEKLQLEVNALKIQLSGTPSNIAHSNISTRTAINTKYNKSWTFKKVI